MDDWKDVHNKMAYREIDVKVLKNAVNAILDHVIDDLEWTKVEIEESSDFYWHVPNSELYDMSKSPIGPAVGRLSDDVDFLKLIAQGQSADAAYNLVHIAP